MRGPHANHEGIEAKMEMLSVKQSRLTFISILGLALLVELMSVGCGSFAPPSDTKTPGAMSYLQALVLGVVEGVTEYLPVSSTGHLLLAQRAMGIGGGAKESGREGARRKEASDAYAICIQGGAILAVLFLYARRVRGMALGLLGRDPAGLQLAFRVAMAFLPAAILGLMLEGWIKSHLFGPWPVVAAWFAGGAGILGIARWMRGMGLHSGDSLEAMTWRMAIVVGLIQCVAMWPGVSRSLATIVGGLMVGLSLPAAVEFSFLLGVVTLGAATGYDAIKHGQAMLEAFDALPMAMGCAAAFLSAVLAVKWMVDYLNRHGLEIFGYYRMGVALIAAALLLAGWL